MDIFLITGNQNKRREFQKLMDNELDVHFIDIDLMEPQSDDIVSINEFKAKRAHEILRNQSGPDEKLKRKLVITDDTGLYMDCLNSFPGPYIKWMMKNVGSKGIVDIASKLQNDKCHAICVYSVYDGKQIYSFKGVTQGRIMGPCGSNDFGWDNIFSPENSNKTFSEMSFDEKKNFSPRFKAFVQLKAFLLQELKKQKI
ncbi:HAM1 domain containing protein [Plasmodium gonderi]|uniref:HAM1 domain containing protein n=1 Tax=Plasmodium gonderi TaxID=77519 RepID=A0A1Y1JDR0_PLAGO|nr:HAM1 domain containing protein [Plasmodium gonderi]GAW79347.1 HAM1 domain containing protein [Plasmodium gonderi]